MFVKNRSFHLLPVVTLFLVFSVFGVFPAVADEAAWIAALEKDGNDDPTLFEQVTACRQLATHGSEAAIPVLVKRLGDERLDTYAHTALRNIPSPKVADTLRDRLLETSGRERVNIIGLLGDLRDKDSAATLSYLVHDDDTQTATAAVRALGKIASPASTILLLNVLEKTDNPNLRTEIVDAVLAVCDTMLQEMGDKAGQENERVVQWAETLLAMEGLPPRYRAAAHRAAILASGAQAMDRLVPLLESEDETLFACALGTAREIRRDDFVQKYVEAITDLPPERLARALSVLCDRPDVDMLPDIVLDLAKSSATAAGTRRAALEVIGVHGNAHEKNVSEKDGENSCVPVLLTCLADENPEVSIAAADALARLQGEAVDKAIVAQLHVKGEYNVKRDRAVLELIGQRRIVPARETVFRIADTVSSLEAPMETVTLRQAALDTLGKVASAEMLPRMVASLNRDADKEDPEKTTWNAAIRAVLERQPDRDVCVQKLREGLDGVAKTARAEKTRCEILEMLPLVGGEAALKMLAENAESPYGAVRDAATKALGQWTGPDAAPLLLRLSATFKEKKDDRLHLRTLRGLIRILRQFDMPREERLKLASDALPLCARDEERKMLDEVIRRWQSKAVAIFDGKTFDGWEGDTENSFRIEDGAVVGGNLEKPIPRNEFLVTKKRYGNFVLTLECKGLGEGCNGGIQIRSERVPDHHEMIGYQADMDQNGDIWGNLYDESRRNRNLVEADHAEVAKVFKKDDWNRYEIRCEGKRIRLFLNGLLTADYTEADDAVVQEGVIGLQIHGGPPSETWYRNIVIEEL